MIRLIISSNPFLTRVAKINESKMCVYTIRKKSESVIVGNIYKGVVKNISHSLNAAFIDIGTGKNAFLSLDKYDEAKPFNVNDNVLVQVFKPTISTKGPKVTTNITIPGNYIVLLRDNNFIGVSKQIKDSDTIEKLKNFLKRFAGDKIGFIARTASQHASFRDLENELSHLLSINRLVTEKSSAINEPALIFEEPPLPIWVIREYCDENTNEVIFDEEYVYKHTKQYLLNIGSKCVQKLKLYSHKKPVFEYYGIDKNIESLESSMVTLKNGGYITIEKTEALFAVDVNSGKYNYDQEAEQAIFEINKEAAYEIFNQIALRDMGGLIVVDFIDMESEEHKTKLESILNKLAEKDKREMHVGSISQFGLVEISRRKNGNDIFDKMFDKCESCLNSGLVKNISLVCSEIYEKIRYENSKFTLTATANVIEYMQEKIGYLNNRIRYEIKSGCNAEDYNLEVVK